MWYTRVYYTTIYAYTQYTKEKLMQKIRPLLVFVDLRCQTSVLNVKERRQFYWEHRGMMDNEDYARHTVDRIKQYLKSGIVIGRDLIITEETSSSPPGTDEIECIIRTFFL